MPLASKNVISLNPYSKDEAPPTIESVIIRRGSPREFSRESISFDQLSTIIYYSTRGVPADFLEPYGNSLIELYLIVNAVDGLRSGSYVYSKEQNALELLREGRFRDVAGNLFETNNFKIDLLDSLLNISPMNFNLSSSLEKISTFLSIFSEGVE
ncbi:MAG: hypothetical protein ACREAG_06240, partial [Nitrosopumilaceae archaeon]